MVIYHEGKAAYGFYRGIYGFFGYVLSLSQPGMITYDGKFSVMLYVPDFTYGQRKGF